MHPRRSHALPFLLLVVVFLLASCQRATPTAVRAEKVEQARPTETRATATQRATATPRPTLPPTWTPQPNPALMGKTATITPTTTATPNNRQTLAAATQISKDTPCSKYDEAWQVRLEKSWRLGWCTLDGDPISYYEYNIEFPAIWRINTFGDRHPNLIFVTGHSSQEVRLYQVYAYETNNYTGSLEDAPTQAAFCEKGSTTCVPVIGPFEQTTRIEQRQIGTKALLIVDGIDGKRSVRRYFFTVNFVSYQPKSTRLFMVKVYTPRPINAVLSGEIEGEEPYAELIQQVEEIIISLRPDSDRRATPWPTAIPTRKP